MISTGYIQDAYTTMPAEFGRFVVIVDPINQRIIPWWCTAMELDLLDPTRKSVESVPRMIIPSGMSPLTASLGQPQFEFWPKPSAAGALQYYAVRRLTNFADTDLLPGILRERPDALEHGALSHAARWPGTKDRPNPYFNLQLSILLEKQFEAAALQLDLRDDDQSQQSWDTIPWQRWSAWAWAYDTRLLQSTDATIGDYFGGGMSGGLF